jgi:hypothetical protein
VGSEEKIKNRGKQKEVRKEMYNDKKVKTVVMIMTTMTRTVLKSITMELLTKMNMLVVHFTARKK